MEVFLVHLLQIIDREAVNAVSESGLNAVGWELLPEEMVLKMRKNSDMTKT